MFGEKNHRQPNNVKFSVLYHQVWKTLPLFPSQQWRCIQVLLVIEMSKENTLFMEGLNIKSYA